MLKKGMYKSVDQKYSLEILDDLSPDPPFELTMPVMQPMVGVLKGGEIANLKTELKGKAVFIYLFVERVSDEELVIKASGRSAGRFSGDIPSTSLFLEG